MFPTQPPTPAQILTTRLDGYLCGPNLLIGFLHGQRIFPHFALAEPCRRRRKTSPTVGNNEILMPLHQADRPWPGSHRNLHTSRVHQWMALALSLPRLMAFEEDSYWPPMESNEELYNSILADLIFGYPANPINECMTSRVNGGLFPIIRRRPPFN